MKVRNMSGLYSKTVRWPSLGPVMQSLVMSLENVCTLENVCFSKLAWGAWIVLIVFPFWTARGALENYHGVWKDRHLVRCKACWIQWRYFSLLCFFPGNLYPSAQFSSRRPCTRRDCLLHESTIFLSGYVKKLIYLSVFYCSVIWILTMRMGNQSQWPWNWFCQNNI